MHLHDTFRKLCPIRTTSKSLAREIAEFLGAAKIVETMFRRVKTAHADRNENSAMLATVIA